LTPDPRFPGFVSLACHDLRTPLATILGFARTLERLGAPEQTARYLEMIAAASAQMAELLDLLALVARIESGRFEPVLTEVDSLELARAAAERASGDVTAAGDGAAVRVDRESAERAVAAFATCAIRHGDVQRVTIGVVGTRLRLSPIAPGVGPIVTGAELRDLGAAAAARLIVAIGGSVALDTDTLEVELPAT
jgi:signal transduction histidine kinase